ncbi:hypothetical protein QCD60_10210 [Pokkaliibacter sp. MBI-7]|uniref:hypothetical protein n=1 Tax=Pokkaliibacter sp. MBI-7 TaxID=3040600 RepID=UPI00244AD4D1|nr:hypothetical protein [Pokkaliibacter sp. MBI-7]MDH2432939.1 hypothetical protein [Pokkaliibacter sp. MBI-7]
MMTIPAMRVQPLIFRCGSLPSFQAMQQGHEMDLILPPQPQRPYYFAPLLPAALSDPLRLHRLGIQLMGETRQHFQRDDLVLVLLPDSATPYNDRLADLEALQRLGLEALQDYAVHLYPWGTCAWALCQRRLQQALQQGKTTWIVALASPRPTEDDICRAPTRHYCEGVALLKVTPAQHGMVCCWQGYDSHLASQASGNSDQALAARLASEPWAAQSISQIVSSPTLTGWAPYYHALRPYLSPSLDTACPFAHYGELGTLGGLARALIIQQQWQRPGRPGVMPARVALQLDTLGRLTSTLLWRSHTAAVPRSNTTDHSGVHHG